MAIVNLTPHDVAVFDERGGSVVYPASGRVARVVEIVGAPADLATREGTVPVCDVSYADEVAGRPASRESTVYLVSRVTAAAVSRDDLVFPLEEVRDSSGRIIGCRSLGAFRQRGGRLPRSGPVVDAYEERSQDA